MSKFKVGDMVVIAEPGLDSEECYRGFVRRIHSIDGYGLYYFEDIKDEDGDMIPWMTNELELVEPINDRVESLYPHLIRQNFKLSKDLKREWDGYGIDGFYKHYILGKPCNNDDNIDATRYCINDLMITKDCCEKIEEEKYMSDIMKFYENKKRNEVLELWYEKKKHKIIDKYDKLEEEFNKKQYSVVESFNELIEQFNKDLDGLFQFDKASEQFVLKENAPSNVYKYKIDYDKLRDEFVDNYIKKRNKELNKVKEEYEEIKAQLSLSDDLDYQIEMLNRYGILNKKTKKISD